MTPAEAGPGPLTVCIAAICENNIVVGASDRMVTSADISFEPATPKIRVLTTSIVVMTSGDAAFQEEFLQGAATQVSHLIANQPDRWLSVQEVAELIIDARNEAKLKRSSAALLGPLGLNQYSFLHGAHSLGEDLSRKIATDMIQFAVPHTSCIVCGIDPTGAHIFTVYDGALYCNDTAGFAAIGMGGRHAESQLMLAEHSRAKSLAETLLLIYAAKRRAEVAPGVGAATDLVTLGPQLGTLAAINDEVVAHLEEAYGRLRDDEKKALNVAKLEIEAYVDTLRNSSASAQEPAAADTAGDDPPPGG